MHSQKTIDVDIVLQNPAQFAVVRILRKKIMRKLHQIGEIGLNYPLVQDHTPKESKTNFYASDHAHSLYTMFSFNSSGLETEVRAW